MSSKKFCKKFSKANELSSDESCKLIKTVKNLLKNNPRPTKSEIKNEILSILPKKIAKQFSKDFYAELNSNSNDYEDYDNDYDSKSEKKYDKSKKEAKKPKKIEEIDYSDNDNEYYYSNPYYSYSDYDYYDDFYSDSENSNKKPKRDFKGKLSKEKYQTNYKSSASHITTAKTIFSPALSSSDYQRLSKDIEQKKVLLSHRQYDRKHGEDNDENGWEDNSNTKSTNSEIIRQRFIIYVAGLSPQVNSVSKLYHQFYTFGRILAIQVNRPEQFALIEFNDLKSAFGAVYSKKPVFGNKLIKRGFASNVDNEMVEMYKKKEEEIEKQSKEMKSDLIILDVDKQSDVSYNESDDESYDMPDV